MLNCLVYTALCLLSPQKMAKLTKIVLTSLFRYEYIYHKMVTNTCVINHIWLEEFGCLEFVSKGLVVRVCVRISMWIINEPCNSFLV